MTYIIKASDELLSLRLLRKLMVIKVERSKFPCWTSAAGFEEDVASGCSLGGRQAGALCEDLGKETFHVDVTLTRTAYLNISADSYNPPCWSIVLPLSSGNVWGVFRCWLPNSQNSFAPWRAERGPLKFSGVKIWSIWSIHGGAEFLNLKTMFLTQFKVLWLLLSTFPSRAPGGWDTTVHDLVSSPEPHWFALNSLDIFCGILMASLWPLQQKNVHGCACARF